MAPFFSSSLIILSGWSIMLRVEEPKHLHPGSQLVLHGTGYKHFSQNISICFFPFCLIYICISYLYHKQPTHLCSNIFLISIISAFLVYLCPNFEQIIKWGSISWNRTFKKRKSNSSMKQILSRYVILVSLFYCISIYLFTYLFIYFLRFVSFIYRLAI